MRMRLSEEDSDFPVALAGTAAVTTLRSPPGADIPALPPETVLVGGVGWLVVTHCSRSQVTKPAPFQSFEDVYEIRGDSS